MPGRPFLQVPGPTNVPERILRAMAQPVLDYRGPALAAPARELRAVLKRVFQATAGTVVLFPGSGTAGWEAAIVNTLAPGDRVLAAVNGQFGTLFAQCAQALGREVEGIAIPRGAAVSPAAIQERLPPPPAPPLQAGPLVRQATPTRLTPDGAARRGGGG